MIYLYAINIKNENFTDKIETLLTEISEERANRAKKFLLEIDQIRCILGEIILQYILLKHYQIARDEIVFHYNEYGKPLLNGKLGIQFNISHSGEWILCGVSENDIGIDIEGYNNTDMLSIAKRFFVEDEYEYIMTQLKEKRQDAFYQIWTLKESYIKCIGKGLSHSLSSFHFEINENNIEIYQDKNLNKEYSFLSRVFDENYRVAICARQYECKLYNDTINQLTIENLILR